MVHLDAGYRVGIGECVVMDTGDYEPDAMVRIAKASNPYLCVILLQAYYIENGTYYGLDSNYLDSFDASRAIAREAQVFNAGEMLRLAPLSYTINELIRYKNFWGGEGVSGLKQLMDVAIQYGAATQSDYDKLNGILKEQGIDLDVAIVE
jgi:hypothetical protein